MLADDIVADPDLAERGVHILDEHFGEQGDRLAPGFAFGLEPDQRQCHHRRDHVEAAVERVGHARRGRYQKGSRPRATNAR